MKLDVDRCIELLKERKLPDVESIKQLCIRAREILVEESNVLEVPAPVTIVGDIHGQVSFFNIRNFPRVVVGVCGDCVKCRYVWMTMVVMSGVADMSTI